MKGIEMLTCPYRTLMRYKRWSTDGLNAVLADTMDRFDEPHQILILRVLDHIQTVDEIFSHNLEARGHAYAVPRSAVLPSFETLVDKSRSIGAWYVDYTDRLTPDMVDEAIDFSFSNGAPARMTRGEMILHVASHGAGHRGNIGALLQMNGIQPNPDRITDFLEAERA
ncbi:DinB family protein [Sphingomonas alpina]|uniref:Damage-inducible protein DinB n=1 Tax=Sphingomonas alpina TaxID=653931 RepID=A0A7H0LJL9_9SPHN|nr:DinB family protein [Sphingomonas alpina]QNQ09872.1 hypothetical protein H3Z74_01015 [Sphingomonas alpina]